jgi:isocitrate lyase
VVRLRGTIPVEHSIARITAEKLWRYLNEKPFVNALGALTGNQAMQQVKRRSGRDLSVGLAGGRRCQPGRRHVSGSVAVSGRFGARGGARINNTLRRADELHHAEGDDSIDWLKPIVADAEADLVACSMPSS